MSVIPIFKRLKQEDCHEFEVITVTKSTLDKHRFKRRLYFWKNKNIKQQNQKPKTQIKAKPQQEKEDGISMKSLVLLWLDGWQTGFYQNSPERDQIGWELDFHVFSLQLEVLNGCVQVHVSQNGGFFFCFWWREDNEDECKVPSSPNAKLN